jgi:hypothetical protein
METKTSAETKFKLAKLVIALLPKVEGETEQERLEAAFRVITEIFAAIRELELNGLDLDSLTGSEAQELPGRVAMILKNYHETQGRTPRA